jgi:ABC-type transporter Mla subunit MlaD
MITLYCKTINEVNDTMRVARTDLNQISQSVSNIQKSTGSMAETSEQLADIAYYIRVNIIPNINALIYSGNSFVAHANHNMNTSFSYINGYDGILSSTNRNMQQSFDIINNENGTLKETNKTLLAVKSDAVHADMIISHEERRLSTLDNQEETIYENTNDSLKSFQQLINNPYLMQIGVNTAGITSDIHVATTELITKPSSKKLSWLQRILLFKRAIGGK